jgi:hypothetical protein
MQDRFEVFPDPLNKWIVWDTEKEDIVELGNQVLQFLSEDEARGFSAVLNRQEEMIAA